MMINCRVYHCQITERILLGLFEGIIFQKNAAEYYLLFDKCFNFLVIFYLYFMLELSSLLFVFCYIFDLPWMIVF